ncbi:hypothetical protein H6A18_09515 [Collinsella tanakaei]|uniref:hypothetical protein n=1 Tax=Collinsella tanakaei TaxID=626935 RepID=UPI00195AD42D|nr:hypothetical protein [Collinsella tanakaei]MBM6756739.1 hypothetical protein [Collinsella tanakaei]
MDVIVALAKAAMGVVALALLSALAWVLAVVVGTAALIARDRIEDAVCAARRNRRRRRGRF